MLIEDRICAIPRSEPTIKNENLLTAEVRQAPEVQDTVWILRRPQATDTNREKK